MSELAAHGGALQVDPRDVGSITAAMRQLLTDDALVSRLRTEAAARPKSSWDDYADRLWRALVAEDDHAPQEEGSPLRIAETTEV
jgi:glycosyltransferase involved in cell wall biosynthesis